MLVKGWASVADGGPTLNRLLGQSLMLAGYRHKGSRESEKRRSCNT